MAENTKKWDETGRRYRSYIKLEKRLSENTVESYMRDYMQFAHFILRQWDVAPHKVEPQMVERYMAWLYERGREKTSQARAAGGRIWASGRTPRATIRSCPRSSGS